MSRMFLVNIRHELRQRIKCAHRLRCRVKVPTRYVDLAIVQREELGLSVEIIPDPDPDAFVFTGTHD